MTTNKEKLIKLLDYVTELVRVSERTIYSVRSYKQLLIFEHELCGLPGVYLMPSSSSEVLPWIRFDRLVQRRPPQVDAPLSDWLVVSDDPQTEPHLHKSRTVTVEQTEAEALVRSGQANSADVLQSPRLKYRFDVVLHRANHPNIDELAQAYLEGPWHSWREAEIPRRKSIKIYQQLFKLSQMIMSGAGDTPIEIVLGKGVAIWKTEFGTIEHPIVESIVELRSNDVTAAIDIIPKPGPPQLFSAPFADLGALGLSRLQSAFEQFRFQFNFDLDSDSNLPDFTPFESEHTETVLRTAASCLAEHGSYWPDRNDLDFTRELPKPTDELVVTDTWVIFARPRSSNVYVRDIEQLRHALEGKTDADLSTAITNLVSSSSDRPRSSIAGIGDPHNTCDHLEETPVYFPKPFNEAQARIVRRLHKKDAVVVQGPPGTGKTHTIANIVCHLLATGKTVLVTAKSEQSLEVLREQIPSEIRQLCVALLSGSQKAITDTCNSISAINQEVTSTDRSALKAQREEAEKKLEQLRSEAMSVESKLAAIASSQVESVPASLGFGAISLVKLADEVKDRAHANYPIDDTITCDERYKPLFDDADIQRLREARSKVGHRLRFLGLNLPDPDIVPSPTDLEDLHAWTIEEKQLCRRVEDFGLGLELPLHLNHQDSLTELKRNLTFPLQIVPQICRKPSLQKHVEAWLADPFQDWQVQIAANLFGLVKELEASRRVFIVRPVSLPESIVARPDALRAVERAANGGGTGFAAIVFPKLKSYLKEIRVQNAEPQNQEDWKHVLAYCRFEQSVNGLLAQWNSSAPDLSLPPAPNDIATGLTWLAKSGHSLAICFDLVRHFQTKCEPKLKELFGEGVARFPLTDSARLTELSNSLDIHLQRLRLQERTTAKLAEFEEFQKTPYFDGVFDLMRKTIGVEGSDLQSLICKWSNLKVELEAHTQLWSEFEDIDRIAIRIEQSGATRWAKQIRSQPAEPDDPLVPADSLSIWKLKRGRSFVQLQDPRGEIRRLTEERKTLAEQLEVATRNVVRLRTLEHLLQKIDGGGYLQSLRQLENVLPRTIGTGQGVTRYQGFARIALEKCREAIPCWIMPSWRICESLPSDIGGFDVVIVDEASQSDITALPALLRGKKLLIVGDDKQVSPSTIGLEERVIKQLQHNFLLDQPLAPQLIPGASLYDLANVAYTDDTILLNEHFRCVRPIIMFSLQFYHPKKILPLRIPTLAERLDPPLVDVFVRNGARNSRKVNKAEADAIVDEIKSLIDDPDFSERSIGVISLIGREQAGHIERLLMDRIGLDKMTKHSIACGDAASFQGKERDIIFLSMVASPGQCQAQTSRMYRQRFNVALSRARDRLYLFRSVDVAHLRNPEDLKLRVIEHFKQPHAACPLEASDIELFDSKFERRVYQWLCDNNYRATPQVPAGDFRIDIVVEGEEGRRLAIELDGDKFHGPDRWAEDYSRQKQLERLGWRFWRCWASSFWLDADSCMQELAEHLNLLGIKPIGPKLSQEVFTEHRVIPELTSTNPSVDAPSVNDASDRDLEVTKLGPGDSILVAFDDEEGGRQHRLRLSQRTENLEEGIVNVNSETGTALTVATVDDEINLPWGDKTRTATVLEIVLSEYSNDQLPASRKTENASAEYATSDSEDRMMEIALQGSPQPTSPNDKTSPAVEFAKSPLLESVEFAVEEQEEHENQQANAQLRFNWGSH